MYSLSENNWISIWKTEPNKGLRKAHTLSNLQIQRKSKSGIQPVALPQNRVKLYFSTSSMVTEHLNMAVTILGNSSWSMYAFHS